MNALPVNTFRPYKQYLYLKSAGILPKCHAKIAKQRYHFTQMGEITIALTLYYKGCKEKSLRILGNWKEYNPTYHAKI